MAKWLTAHVVVECFHVTGSNLSTGNSFSLIGYWIGLDWIGLDWIWIESDCLGRINPTSVQNKNTQSKTKDKSIKVPLQLQVRLIQPVLICDGCVIITSPK